MFRRVTSHELRAILVWWALPCLLSAQIAITGKVVDETGAAVQGARVELRPPGAAGTASSDRAGNFKLTLPAAGDIASARSASASISSGQTASIRGGTGELTIALNHLQEFSDRIDVTYSPPAIDPAQPSDKQGAGQHGDPDGPVPGAAGLPERAAAARRRGAGQHRAGPLQRRADQPDQLHAGRVQHLGPGDGAAGGAGQHRDRSSRWRWRRSRFSAENGRGSAGVLDLKTKMGDDRWRFGGTNFIPGISSRADCTSISGRPRLEVSGPVRQGRAWFHNGFDTFYNADTSASCRAERIGRTASRPAI